MLGLALSLMVAALLALAASRRLGLFIVAGDSMRPNLKPGEWLLVRRYCSWEKPRTGEIVILRQEEPPKVLVKRILAGPGELPSPKLPLPAMPLEAGQYLLAGDSLDLQGIPVWLGLAPREQLWGKAVLVIHPLRRL